MTPVMCPRGGYPAVRFRRGWCTVSTVGVDHVKQLLESDDEDPIVVLLRGRPLVIAASEQDTEEYRGALFVASRRGVLDQVGDPGSSQPELERLATILNDMVDHLGA
jgi:hypothetical protein